MKAGNLGRRLNSVDLSECLVTFLAGLLHNQGNSGLRN